MLTNSFIDLASLCSLPILSIGEQLFLMSSSLSEKSVGMKGNLLTGKKWSNRQDCFPVHHALTSENRVQGDISPVQDASFGLWTIEIVSISMLPAVYENVSD
jgi:hypothetical protein